jgi:transposase
LLELFALGVPVYRQRFRADASLPSRERFYRLARACCARAERLSQPFDSAPKGIIVFAVRKLNGRIVAAPPPAEPDGIAWQEIVPHVRPGHLWYATDKSEAFASLSVCGDRVVLREQAMRPKGREQVDAIEAFWNYAKHWLRTYHSVPRKFFHLYLGEMCFRYNHHDEDITPLLRSLLERTSVQDVKPLLTESARLPDDGRRVA